MSANEGFVLSAPLSGTTLWEKMERSNRPLSFDLEITARCNNNCRHCCINLPAGDLVAKAKELSLEEIKEIAEEAASLGALWCLITGGEPLLREDFFEIYMHLRKKGFLVSVFTNAALIHKDHIDLWKRYPPRSLEVTVYGATRGTHERVTRSVGSYAASMRGLRLLLDNAVQARLKTMAIRSNVEELPEIARFCRKHTKDYFRFDPFLNLRYDGNPVRNHEIISERLSPEEIVKIERADSQRMRCLREDWRDQLGASCTPSPCDHLFRCGAGKGHFNISSDGLFRLCSSLWHRDCLYDLRRGSLTRAWTDFVPTVRSLRPRRREFFEKCGICPLINFCNWCPAHAHLETGHLDRRVDYFCKVAHARVRALEPARTEEILP